MSLTLTIDQGHSHPHLGVFLMGELKEVHPLYEFVENKKELISDSTVVLSNVTEKKLFQENRPTNLINISELKKKESFLSMPYKYSEQLGEDRISLAYYVYKEWIKKKSTKRILVVDAGTFTTVDLVTTNGFEGGYILPGVQTFLNCYSTGDHLPKLEASELTSISKTLPANTNQAILQATALYSSSIIESIKKRCSPDLIILTGGHGQKLMDENTRPYHFDSHLIHKALFLISQEAR
ncbi:MAG: type III pantothenate kinase [Halobacteriovoraceae bacterium]|jgi:type III pantothenate kinase|nr:type III pantothenate kinase [Halobacteriovoraceae bacterium]MBT5094450.1 type III pantothenate kinase [Halobacteriovoraceae bacterium]